VVYQREQRAIILHPGNARTMDVVCVIHAFEAEQERAIGLRTAIQCSVLIPDVIVAGEAITSLLQSGCRFQPVPTHVVDVGARDNPASRQPAE
jgi:hypothetical protein